MTVREFVGLSPVAVLLCGALTVAVGRADAGPEALVDFKGLGGQELRTQGFALSGPQEVEITAAGAETRMLARLPWVPRDRVTAGEGDQAHPLLPWSGNAWILDVRSRQVVWELRRANTTRDEQGVRHFAGVVRMNPGVYEAHFASYAGGQTVVSVSENGRARSMTRVEDLSDAFHFTIRGTGRPVGPIELLKARTDFEKSAVIVLTGFGPRASKQRGFELAKPTEIEVYCLGEARHDAAFDYGTILDAGTREKVWQLSYANSEPAGGAVKNRLIRKNLMLPAGRYIASYVTDGAHDQRGWNEAPPFDPEYWGLTLRVADPARRALVKTFDYEALPRRDTFVSLTGVTNKESRSVGFSLARPVDLRIYALGEGTGGQMHDYGWITNADTRRKVWVMEYDKTTHAGGAQKNRLTDQVVRLEKGNYLLYYVTDDSHAFNAWNSPQPANADLWGISLLLAKGPADRAAVLPFERGDEAAVIARLTRMGDREDARKAFRLEKETLVRIYALGESQENRLHDHAWIENARTRATVWQMDLMATVHAGGARKNRMANVTVTLPAGEYVLRYESDDSHSFGHWNSAPPDDPESWGVTVFRADGKVER